MGDELSEPRTDGLKSFCLVQYDDISNIQKNQAFDLKRLDISRETFQATYLVNIKEIETLEEIIKTIRSEYPEIIINFIDQSQVPSI